MRGLLCTWEFQRWINLIRASLEEQIAYLEAAIDEDDPSFIATAIGDIAKARGVSQFAKETGLSREACHSACNIDPLSRGIGVQN
jgi:probable addiction module antidote protein